MTTGLDPLVDNVGQRGISYNVMRKVADGT